MSRVIAVLGGGDWYDASVNHLVLIGDVDLEAEKERHEKWLKEEYSPKQAKGRNPKYYTFPEWLVKEGLAREATEDEVLIFNE